MSSSTTPPAPASSPPAFTEEMVGRRVSLFLLFPEGRILDVDRQDEQEATLIKLVAPGAVLSSENCFLETKGGIKFQGILELDESHETTFEATISVRDDQVSSCRCCCTDMGIPTPPFSLSIKGMAVRFSQSDPHTIEATILEVQKRPTFSFVVLEMTSLPPYSASIGDIIMLRSGMETWEATVMYFGDHSTKLGVENIENRVCIHVLDKHAPQGPKCLPHTAILVRPAQGIPKNISFRCPDKESKKKRKYRENEANKEKIKVAINGYTDMGRALARVALDSADVDLVAINDPSITDQVSCMFRDSQCDFEVKSHNPRILSFGQKEVRFFMESDPTSVPWYIASTNFVVTISNFSQNAEYSCKNFVAKHTKDSDVKLSGPLENMLGSCNSRSSTPNNSRFPILQIRPITASDAKAVSDCFPLWKGKHIASVVRFQGVDMIFRLREYPGYELLPNNTKASIDFSQLVRWCFHMLSRSQAAVCDVEISTRPRQQSSHVPSWSLDD